MSQSLLRELGPGDFITLGNAACGTASIFCTLHALDMNRPDLLIWAMGLVPIAFVLDALDGMVARKTRGSPYGGDLDSLADTVSFGVAPAVLGFGLGLRGGWDALILIIYVCCGIGRLARFNVTAEDMMAAREDDSGKVSHFEGTPITIGLLVVAVMAGMHFWGGDPMVVTLGWQLHPIVAVYAITGALMISRVKIPKP
jgi:CDP-diacylglycerol---serine O-phosphatidyltransferase